MPQPVDSDKPACSINLTSTCVNPAYDDFYGSDEITNCFESCPLECNSVGFEFELSHGDYPSPNYAQIMLEYASRHSNPIRNFTSYEQIKSSSLAFSIYFDDIAYSLVYFVSLCLIIRLYDYFLNKLITNLLRSTNIHQKAWNNW